MPLLDGLKQHWPLNGAITSAIGALALTNNNSTPYASGRFSRQAASFDGTSNFSLSVANASLNNLTTSFSIHAYVNPSSGAIGNQCLFSSWGSSVGSNSRFLVRLTSGRQVQLVVKSTNDATTIVSSLLSTAIPVGTWASVVVTFTPTQAKLYVRNVLVDTLTYTSTGLTGTASTPFVVGLDNTNERMKGLVQDVMTWNRVITATDIEQLHNDAQGFNVKPHSLLTGLVAAWRLNGDANEDFNGLNGTFTGATYAAGLFPGQAASFDGTTSKYIVAPHNAAISFGAGSFSVAAWFRIASGGSGQRSIVQKAISASNSFEYRLHVTSTGKLQGVIQNDTLSSTITLDQVLPVDTWLLGVIKYDGALFSVHVDGNKAFRYAAYTSGTFASTSPLSIGQRGDGASHLDMFNGRIGPVFIWNRALNEQEIDTLYNHGVGLNSPFMGSISTSSSSIIVGGTAVGGGGVTSASSVTVVTEPLSAGAKRIVGGSSQTITTYSEAKVPNNRYINVLGHQQSCLWLTQQDVPGVYNYVRAQQAKIHGRTIDRQLGVNNNYEYTRVFRTDVNMVDSDYTASNARFGQIDFFQWDYLWFKVWTNSPSDTNTFNWNSTTQKAQVQNNLEVFARGVEAVRVITGKKVGIIMDTENYSGGDRMFNFGKTDDGKVPWPNPDGITWTAAQDKAYEWGQMVADAIFTNCPSADLAVTVGPCFIGNSADLSIDYYGLVPKFTDGIINRIKVAYPWANFHDFNELAYNSYYEIDVDKFLKTSTEFAFARKTNISEPSYHSYFKGSYSVAPSIYNYVSLTEATTNLNILRSDQAQTPGGAFGRTAEVWFTKAGDFDGPGVLRLYTNINSIPGGVDTVTVNGSPFSTEVLGYVGFLSPQRLHALLAAAKKQTHRHVWLYEGGDGPLAGSPGEQWTWTTYKPNAAVNFRNKLYPGAFFRAMDAAYNDLPFNEVPE